jgi:hypothetical protein
VEEGEAAKPLFQRECRETLVGERRAGADAITGFAHRLPEALRRQADDHAGNAAVTDKEIGADADDGYGDIRIQFLKQACKVVGVGRLEQELRRTADAEPGERRQRRVLREPAADAGEIAEVTRAQGDQSFGACSASMASMAASRGPRSF